MRARFVTSADQVAGFPRSDRAEIAFVGRSNVGKSSLLNALVGAKLARTSRTPGRTQLINFFEVDGRASRFMLADLPGYGFARAPGGVRERWRALVADYLRGREALVAALLLLDVRREVEAEDAAFCAELSEVLGARNADVLVIATKADKLGKAELKPALGRMAAALGIAPAAILATSTPKAMGLDALRARVDDIARRTGRVVLSPPPRVERPPEPDARPRAGATSGSGGEGRRPASARGRTAGRRVASGRGSKRSRSGRR